LILGLDVSTSITGATVMDKDGKCLYNEMWDTRNKSHFPDQYQKATLVKHKLLDIQDRFYIEQIYIEEPFTFFNSGGSKAKIMATLQRFNGIVAWLCYNTFDIKPQMITPMLARKTVGIKVSRGKKAKEVSFDFVLANEPTFVVEYTRHGNPKPGTMDRSDSWVIAKAGHILWNQKN